jgi:hypothetical protein
MGSTSTRDDVAGIVRHSPASGDFTSNKFDDFGSSIYFDAMAVDATEARRMVEAATSSDPETGLAAVLALRRLVEVLETLQVDNARAAGWSWRDIADRLELTKQAVHYKHGSRFRGR